MAGNISGSGNAEGLVEYLDILVSKGRATSGAITPLKTAFIKVLEEVDEEGWQQTKVNEIDVDDYISRFANLTRGKYTTKSISVYKSRLNRVIGWYKKFMSSSEAGWMPSIDSRAPSKKKSTIKNSSKQTTKDVSEHKIAIIPPKDKADNDLIDYPFPLRDGQIAKVMLPAKLYETDARRIANFVSTLVINDIDSKGRDFGNEEKDQN